MIYGYGESKKGQTLFRCKKAERTYRKARRKKLLRIIIPSHDRKGIVIYKYLTDHGTPRKRIIADMQGKNTLQETIVAIRHIPQGAKVTVVSSWYHLLRIFLLWLILARKIVRISMAFGGDRKKNLLTEPIKIIKDVQAAIAYRRNQNPA